MIIAGLVYFALVFGAGFLLGPPRILWLVPLVGQRTAELIETPIMLMVIYFSARWVVRRFSLSGRPAAALGAGGLALLLLLLMEFTLVLYLQGRSIEDYLASRDPVSGTVYAVSLLIFGLMPLWFSRRQAAR